MMVERSTWNNQVRSRSPLKVMKLELMSHTFICRSGLVVVEYGNFLCHPDIERLLMHIFILVGFANG